MIQNYELGNQNYSTMWDLELEPRIFNSSSPETFPQMVLRVSKQVI